MLSQDRTLTHISHTHVLDKKNSQSIRLLSACELELGILIIKL
jgi:hypothetical protein